MSSSEIASFVAACKLLIGGRNDEERRRGERALLTVKESASPWSLCLSVVEQCSSREPEVAFQAISMMASAVLTEWHNVSADTVEALRRRLLWLMMEHRNGTRSGHGLVVRAMAKTVAILFKRKWRSEDALTSMYGDNHGHDQQQRAKDRRSELEQFNREQICGAMVSVIEPLLTSNEPSVAAMGLMLCSEFMEQFSVNTAASALGLSGDFHIDCHRGFERWALQNIFVLTANLIDKMRADMVSGPPSGSSSGSRSGSTSIPALNRKSKILGALRMEQQSSGQLVAQSVADMVSLAAMVIAECLSFDFHEKTSDDELLLSFARNTNLQPLSTSQRRSVRPGAPWRRCIVDNDVFQSLAVMHHAVHCHLMVTVTASNTTSTSTVSALRATLHSLREALCDLSALNGHILDDDVPSDSTHCADADTNGGGNGDGDGDDDDDENIENRCGHNQSVNGNDSKSKSGSSRRVSFKLEPQRHRRRLTGDELVERRLPYLRKLALCFKRYLWRLIEVKVDGNGTVTESSSSLMAQRVDSSLMLDLCRILEALTTNFRREILVAISESEWTENGIFAALRSLGLLLIDKMRPLQNSDTETWIDEAFDVVVQSVVSLVSCYELRKRTLKKQSTAILAVLGSLCHDLFHQFTLKVMRSAEPENGGQGTSECLDIECDANEEAEWETINERLLGLAVMGRMDCRRSLPMLASTMSSIVAEMKTFKHQLAQFVAASTSNSNQNRNGNQNPNGNELQIRIPDAQRQRLEVMKERLFWTLHLLGYTLADDPYSEAATIPNMLIQRSAEEENRCLVESILPLFEWMEFESGCIVAGGPMLEMTSSVLGAATMKMVCRWSSCYLMPNVAYYETVNVGVLRHFGDCKEGGAAVQALDAVVRKCSVNLMRWRGEHAVWKATVSMLRALTKHSSIRPLLLKSRAWNEGILGPFFERKLDLFAFPEDIASSLVAVVVQSMMSNDGGDSEMTKRQRFDKVADGIISDFKVHCAPFVVGQSGRRRFNSEQLRLLMGSIVAVHGVAASGSEFTFRVLLRGNVLSILIELVSVSASLWSGFGVGTSSEWMESNAVQTILAVFGRIAETALFDLDRAESAQFITLCVQLMEALQRHNERRMKSLSTNSSSSKEQCRELQRAELLEMLKLMEFMATKDMMLDLSVDMDSASGSASDSDSSSMNVLCGHCLFKSLYVLTPMMTADSGDLLQYQALSERFHEVLSLSVRGFTLCFAAKLTAEQRATILGDRLTASLRGGEAILMEHSLDILQCLSEFHLEHDAQSPLLQFVEPALPDLVALLIDVRSPKALWPKLCETMLPVLAAVPNHRVFQILSVFIDRAATRNVNAISNRNFNPNAKRQRLALCFKELMDRVTAICTPDYTAVLQLRTKLQFKQYLIGFAHRIRSIVTVH